MKSRIQSARIAATGAASREIIPLCRDMGHEIVEKQETMGWGKSVVERLSFDLKAEFPGIKGLSANNPWFMRQFYAEYYSTDFLEQPVQELPGRRLPNLSRKDHAPLIGEPSLP
jgi:hypothetical protein